ncbi:hypothetical protein [Amycolatopsis sp. NPDC051371]|uniref:hypothetical protein n=1 Tax=Amycolatopsis sp. NPDC051371 TaxID=3155800 RepID=UPI003416E6F4
MPRAGPFLHLVRSIAARLANDARRVIDQQQANPGSRASPASREQLLLEVIARPGGDLLDPGGRMERIVMALRKYYRKSWCSV